MAPVGRLIRVVIIVPAILLMMAIVITVAPVPVAPMPMPPSVMISVSIAPTAMVPVTAVAIPVTPPAAITRLLNRCGLLRLQRRNVSRKHRGARLRSISHKCNGHRAAQRDERKQFSHMLLPSQSSEDSHADLCARSVDRSTSILHLAFVRTTQIRPNPCRLKPLVGTVWHVRVTTEFGIGREGLLGTSGDRSMPSTAPN